jgi:acyl-coenzyme A thioesterase PaaI-like protein
MENDAGLQMRFYEDDRTGAVEVSARYAVPKRFQGYPGVAHGGIIASMLDEVTSRVVMRGDPPRFVVTGKLSIRYRRPVPIETPLILNGRLVEDKGRVITTAGEIRSEAGEVLAEAEAVLFEVERTFFEGMSAAEEQGWRIYPEEGQISAGGEA